MGLLLSIPRNLKSDDERTIEVNRAFIHLTALPAKDVIGLKATPFAIREDAGVKEVTLEVSLRNPVSKDERVRFNFENGVGGVEPEDLSDAFNGSESWGHAIRIGMRRRWRLSSSCRARQKGRRQ